ncbi:MAG: pseudouridine-5'-phosphate glycosidase [Candidatus Cloacimonadota bacterium]|nr:pseudouridine-5'-phosphate glycosidase [Candidatus Cloacimonadota bacterium]
MNNLIELSKEVKLAFEESKPVVALESTIISHGMPYPQNYETARELENICRDNGVIPATICLMNGKIKIGLEDDELKELATQKGVMKVSIRDMGFCLSQNKTGATTVASTMFCAELVGVKVFATGGIGGVHRGAESTFDISADLKQFSQSKVIVVCAGAKAILDLPKTLEYLETEGVPVIGYKTDEFPAFYSQQSGLKVLQIDEPKKIADIFKFNQNIGLRKGVIVGNPIPIEAEIPREIIGITIEKALKEAKEQNVKGKDTTPFLLKRIVELTEGKSLITNIALVKNNVEVACKIAKEL